MKIAPSTHISYNNLVRKNLLVGMESLVTRNVNDGKILIMKKSKDGRMKMLISNILLSDLRNTCKYINEKEVEYLALIDSNVEKNTCIFIEDEKYISKIPRNATMIITKKNLADNIINDNRGVIITENPKIFFFSLHNYLSNNENYRREINKTIVGKDCEISCSAYISEENVCIGKNVIIEPFAVIHSNVVIGDNSRICSGAIIGGNGFEFKRNESSILSVIHLGGVVLGENVEVQSGSCIDRAVYPWDNTVVGDFTKLDNLVHIGHAAKIGKRVLFAARATISGRVTIGDDTWIGVGTTISNGLSIGKKARVNIGAVVTRNVDDSGSVTGNFAIPHKKFIENLRSQR